MKNTEELTPEEEDYYRKHNELIDRRIVLREPIRHGCLAEEHERLGGAEMIKLRKILAYRRAHPSELLLKELGRWLTQRDYRVIPENSDLLVDPYRAPSWMRKQIYLRMVCLMFMEALDSSVWHKAREKPDRDPEVRTEGWLLVENQQIIGAAVFRRGFWVPPEAEWSEPRYRWTWIATFIDPEHRGQGHLGARLSPWMDRYGHFLMDRPNPQVWAMIERRGLDRALRVIDTTVQKMGGFAAMMPVGYSLEAFYDQTQAYAHHFIKERAAFAPGTYFLSQFTNDRRGWPS